VSTEPAAGQKGNIGCRDKHAELPVPVVPVMIALIFMNFAFAEGAYRSG
jgi:hypothetical protein